MLNQLHPGSLGRLLTLTLSVIRFILICALTAGWEDG